MSSKKLSEGHQSKSRDPLKLIEKEQSHLLSLCDRLEEIADEFPDHSNSDTSKKVAQELRSALPRLHNHIQQILFPMLQKRALPQDSIEEIIAGFTHEHAMDDGYVLGVLEILDELSIDRRILELRAANYEAAGYLLRGFFEALRRHLRWQNFIVLRLARQRLRDEDLIELSHQMSIDGS